MNQPLFKLPAQPRARHLPIALDSSVADAQYFGGFLYGESAKKAQFDDPFLLRIEGR